MSSCLVDGRGLDERGVAKSTPGRAVVKSRTEAGLNRWEPCSRQREGSTMAERDGYIPGVPCWIDTSQPDPDAAARFYGGLFGWEFEDVMPEGAESKYLTGHIRGGDVAAISSQQEA